MHIALLTTWAPESGAGLPLPNGQTPHPNQAARSPNVRSPFTVEALLTLLGFNVIAWLLLHTNILLGYFIEGYEYHPKEIIP